MMGSEQKFKETEIGGIPEEWGVVRLGDIFEFSRKPRSFAMGKKQKIPFIPMEFISEDKERVNGWQIKTFSEISSGTFVFKKDLIVAKITPSFENGKQAILDNLPADYGYATTEIWALHPKNEKAIVEQLYNYLKIPSVRADLASKMEGTTGRQRLPRYVLENFKIPLPPLPEQRRIAAVLSTVQNAKEKTEAVISATRELKRSLMKHLFTYGVVPVEEAENVPLVETEIGLVPEAWGVVRLGEVSDKTKQKDPRKTPGWRFKYIDVSSISRETLKIAEYKLYQGQEAPSRAKKLVKNKDVIFATVRPTLKRLTLINEEFDGEICSTAFCVLRARENILNPLFMFYAVQRDVFIDEFEKVQRGASYPAITDSDVKNQKIPLPPPTTQQKIASILSTVDRKIEAEENRKKALDELFKTLLNDLMTGRIRVNHLEV